MWLKFGVLPKNQKGSHHDQGFGETCVVVCRADRPKLGIRRQCSGTGGRQMHHGFRLPCGLTPNMRAMRRRSYRMCSLGLRASQVRGADLPEGLEAEHSEPQHLFSAYKTAFQPMTVVRLTGVIVKVATRQRTHTKRDPSRQARGSQSA